MPQSPSPSGPRDNPFWAYRDPHSGRWVTLMTAEQCRVLSQQIFTPKVRQSPAAADPDGSDEGDCPPPEESAS